VELLGRNVINLAGVPNLVFDVIDMIDELSMFWVTNVVNVIQLALIHDQFHGAAYIVHMHVVTVELAITIDVDVFLLLHTLNEVLKSILLGTEVVARTYHVAQAHDAILDIERLAEGYQQLLSSTFCDGVEATRIAAKVLRHL